MSRCLAVLAVLAAGTARAADAPNPNTLTPQEIADGWVQLFDGETTFGWKAEHGDLKVTDGALVLSELKEQALGETPSVFTTSSFGANFELRYDRWIDNTHQYSESLEFRGLTSRQGLGMGTAPQKTWQSIAVKYHYDSNRRMLVVQRSLVEKDHLAEQGKFELSVDKPPSLAVEVGTGNGSLRLRNVKLKPLGMEPIFDGKDLTGWKQYHGDEKRAKSKFTVTPEGWLNVTNGPGDLQTERQWADFVFQGACISNGKHLNSGVFFRCLPGQYQNGYEFQIQNGYKDNDRTKPVDFGTGAIYRRVPVRKVVSNDGEWFTMTLIAHGNHIATWVNGYQTVDWTDTRPPNDNARNGYKAGPGPLSLQGHDPTTNLSFRNLRVAELKKE